MLYNLPYLVYQGSLNYTGWRKNNSCFLYLLAISFFGVTSNQKSTFRKPRTVDDLKVSFREEIATVPQEMLVNVMQNFEERLRACLHTPGASPQRQEGCHLSDIIFRNLVINVNNENCIYYRLFWC